MTNQHFAVPRHAANQQPLQVGKRHLAGNVAHTAPRPAGKRCFDGLVRQGIGLFGVIQQNTHLQGKTVAPDNVAFDHVQKLAHIVVVASKAAGAGAQAVKV